VINDTYLKTVIDKVTVARLATVDSECKPHLIPVVFVFEEKCKQVMNDNALVNAFAMSDTLTGNFLLPNSCCRIMIRRRSISTLL
jgi:nitroimidazol reductase NimA-like FMN-containing flavoprotein (pyridoxamine 5'-phosphate oxidase superfamily)